MSIIGIAALSILGILFFSLILAVIDAITKDRRRPK